MVKVSPWVIVESPLRNHRAAVQIKRLVTFIMITITRETTMKIKQFTCFLAVLLIFTACTAQPSPVIVTETASTAEAGATSPAAPAPAENIFKTPIGDLVYDSARFVEEVHGVTPEKDHKLLLVVIKRPDKSSIDIQKFQDAHMQIFIRGEDGSQTLSTMGGFVEDGFAVGFQVPKTVKTYQLIWGDNLPLEITPDR
jgi:hypothetical protein